MPEATPTPPSEPGSHDADLALARAAARNDPPAVERFLARMRCVGPILAARNRRLGSPLGAEELADLAQDVLALLWRKLSTFGGRAQLETWAYRFCVLELSNVLRKKRRARTVRSVDETDAPAAEAPPTRSDYEHVYRSLEHLDPREAEIVRLKHFRFLTFDEIGRELSISPNTAKTGYYRALVRLREVLRARGEDEA